MCKAKRCQRVCSKRPEQQRLARLLLEQRQVPEPLRRGLAWLLLELARLLLGPARLLLEPEQPLEQRWRPELCAQNLAEEAEGVEAHWGARSALAWNKRRRAILRSILRSAWLSDS